MSTSTTSTSTASAPASTAAQGPAGLRKAAAQVGTDLFASLLALVGDTRQGGALAADPLTADSAQAGAADAGVDEDLNNPLSNLLNWAYPSSLGDLSALAEVPGRARAGPLTPGTGRAMLSPTALGAGPDQRSTPGIDLSGLALKPVAPGEQTDAQTTALLGNGVAQAASLAQASPRTALLAGQTAADAPLNAAADKGRKSGPSVTAMLQARDATGHDIARLQPHALPAASRSTVALDSRLGNTAWRTADPETPSLVPLAAGTSELRRATGDRPAPRDLLAPLTPEATALTSKPGETAMHTEGEGAADHSPGTPEAEVETPGHLGAHQLRHATLRVGEGGAEAIDVQLSISGQEVRVDFRTDSAEARQGLQQSAAPALGELLERSGMQLGGVSVGGQGLASGGGQGSGASEERRSPGRSSQAAEPTEPVAAADGRPRADGSRSLDVFA